MKINFKNKITLIKLINFFNKIGPAKMIMAIQSTSILTTAAKIQKKMRQKIKLRLDKKIRIFQQSIKQITKFLRKIHKNRMMMLTKLE
jgi:hypothetical protein